MTAVQNGIDSATKERRLILFGKNLIDVAGKSILSLLIEEVYPAVLFRGHFSKPVLAQALHPFYVFQIASIVLWSIDDYWYYGKPLIF